VIYCQFLVFASQPNLTAYTLSPGYVQLDATMDNVVASYGGTVRIKCEITGYPLPRYSWYKDDVAVDRTADDSTGETRFNIKTTPWGSRSAILVARYCTAPLSRA